MNKLKYLIFSMQNGVFYARFLVKFDWSIVFFKTVYLPWPSLHKGKKNKNKKQKQNKTNIYNSSCLNSWWNFSNPYFTKVGFFCETWVKYATYLQMEGIEIHFLEFLVGMIFFFQILNFVLFKGYWEQVTPGVFPLN